MAADWSTIASLATAGATLVLAAATFVSVRAGNRTARRRPPRAARRPFRVRRGGDRARQGQGAGPAGGDIERPRPDTFRRLTRDLYVSAGGLGFWQGAFRDPNDPAFAAVHKTVEDRQPMTLDLFYGDHEGGQRTISRFALIPVGDDRWLASVSRHWNLDRPDPR